MRKSILRASAGLQALALLGAGTAASFIVASPAAAQDYTSGVLTGTVRGANGGVVAGAHVTARSIQQGTTFEATTDSNGTFTIPSLTAGDYDVSVEAAGNEPYTATAVQIVSGRTSDLPVQLASSSGNGPKGSIVVVGRRVQAFTGTTTGLNVDVENLTKTVPVARNLTAVILLAPSTSHGDTAFGNLASVSGSSVAENAYYINGLNITNFDNYLGSAEVPFDFYKTVEVKAGGYPAEFGRATGGIVNAVTKSGTNDWMVGMHLNWSPNFLRSDSKNICSLPGCAPSDILDLAHEHKDSTASASLEAGGPIIRDRLFVYGLVQFNRHRYRNVSEASSTANDYTNDSPFWGAKVDAYPLADHHLEFTIFDTRNQTLRTDEPFSMVDGKPVYGNGTAVNAFNGGGVNYVGKYTGRFTNWFTLSAAYGRMRDRFDYVGVAGASGLPLVYNVTGGTVAGAFGPIPYLGYGTEQRFGSYQSPYNTQRKFWRGDADILVNFIGRHHFRVGIDHENDFLQEGTYRSGNDFLCNTTNPATGLPYETQQACTTNGQPAGLEYELRPGGVVELNYYNTKGQFTQKNTAIYAEDEWKPTDRLTINAGIRRDNFEVTDAAGNPFATLNNNWQPRIGLTYNVLPDKSGTIKAFFGDYYLPFASNTAFRNVGGELYFHQRYHYNGFDANGIPIIDLNSVVTTRGDYQSTCPFDLIPGANPDYCSVTGDGKVPTSTTVIDHNLKATEEAEFILGYEQRWHGWKFGITGTYRKLLRESEDSAIDAAVLKYCADKGILDTVNPDTGLTCASYYTGFAQYVINNPGSPITVNLRGVQGQPLVTLTPAELGYPKASRVYKSLEFTFDRPYDGVWALGGSYTLSSAKGNSEGFVQSDFGQDDAGITQDFDQPGFIPGAYGRLPNDRRHRFKLFGSYTLFHQLTLGANIDIESPRPESCFGYNPTDNFANVYGAASHYCGGKLSPRGTAQHSDWLKQIDVKAAYQLTLPSGLGINLHADVFNVFNFHGVLKRYEFGDLDYTPGADGLPVAYTPDPRYHLPTVYQTPRTVRLGLDILFNAPPAPPAPPPVIAPPPPPPPAAPATQTCPDGTVILATATCPVPPPPPPPPPPPATSGERGQ